MHLHTPRLFQDSIVLRIEDLLETEDATGWIVGSYVRNTLLGRPTPELTVLTTADARRAGMQLVRTSGRTTTVIDSHASGITISVLDSVSTDIQRIQFKRLETDDIHSYLQQRGFTIDALALNVRTHEFIDPVAGYADLNRGRIHTIDSTSLLEEPLRMLSAVRLAATLQFSISLDTLTSIRRHAAAIENVSPSAVFDELMLLLLEPSTATHLSWLDDVNLLGHILPELAECRDVAQPIQHTLDVYGHTLRVVAALEALMTDQDTAARNTSDIWTPPLDRHFEAIQSYLNAEAVPGYTRKHALKLAAVLHDIGKPATYSVDDDGDIHFYGHDEVGAKMAHARLTALGAPADLTEWVTTVIRHHTWPLYLMKSARRGGQYNRQNVFDAHPDLVAAIALHSAADQLGKGQMHLPAGIRMVLHHIWDSAFRSTKWYFPHANIHPYRGRVVAVGA